MSANTYPSGWWGEGWSRFGVFGALGGILILVAHAFFPQARWPIAIFAVALMAAFGYSEWQYKKGQEDRLGDDLYYLGLTYTLVSVAHALYAFTGAASVDRLVSDFSVALLTTLVGIVGRVLLYEKYASGKAPEHIGEGIARLRTEIQSAFQEMHEFRNSMAFNIRKTGDEALSNVHTSFDSFSKSAEQLNEAAKKVNATFTRGATAFDRAFTRVGEASDGLGELVNKLADRTKTLGSASEALNTQIASINSSMAQQTKTMTATLAGQSESVRQFSSSLGSLNNPLTILAGSLGEMRRQIDATRQNFDLTALKTTISGARDAAESLGQNLRSAANAVAPSTGESDQSALQAFTTALIQLTREINNCQRQLGRLPAEQDRTPRTREYSPASQERHALRDSTSSVVDPSLSAARANIYSPGAAIGENTADGSPTGNAVESNRRDINGAVGRDRVYGAKTRGWLPWRRD